MVQSRQVSPTGFSCHGSHASGSSQHKAKPNAKFLVAQLKEKQLKERFDFELRALEERHRRDILKAQHETKLARLMDDLAVDNSVGHSQDGDHEERVRQFVESSPLGDKIVQTDFDVKNVVPPQHALPDFAMVQSTLAPVFAGLELPKVELSTFEGLSRNY